MRSTRHLSVVVGQPCAGCHEATGDVEAIYCWECAAKQITPALVIEHWEALNAGRSYEERKALAFGMMPRVGLPDGGDAA